MSHSGWSRAVLLACALLFLAPTLARAALYSLAASGTISASTEAAIPVGTPWSFEIVYDTAAPDLDFELTGSPDPTFGRFGNASAPPALTSFHYQAGAYEVSLDDAADFAAGSDIDITFTGVHAIDLNVDAPTLFPALTGGAVRFHADFNDFSARPIFVSDGLPTDPSLGPDSFDLSTVSLLPASGEVSGSNITSFVVRVVPEPSIAALVVAGILLMLVGARRPALD